MRGDVTARTTPPVVAGPGDDDADLVGEQNGHAQLLRRRPADLRRRRQDERPDVPPSVADREQDLLVGRQTVPVHVQHPFAATDPPVRLDDGPQVRCHWGEPAAVEPEQTGQLGGDDGDQVTGIGVRAATFSAALRTPSR